jgi:ribonuclease E
MAADSLAALGLELRAEAVAWLAELTPAALPDGSLAARELFTALGALEAEVADAAADEVELTRLQAWLTAGFSAPPEPFAPADAVVAEVMDAARRAGADGGSAGSADADAAGSFAGSAAAGSFAGSAAAGSFAGSAAAGSATAGSATAGSFAGSAGGGAEIDAGRGGGGDREVGPMTTHVANHVANEFAAGTTQRPPARTASGEIRAPGQPRRGLFGGDAFEAENEKQQEPPPTVPNRPKQPPPSSLFGNDAVEADRRRTAADPGDALPRPAGGIQGLAALASLAGRGIEIPAQDPDPPIDPPRGAPDRTAWEPDAAARSRPERSVDADRAGSIDPPPRRAASAEHGVEPGIAREVDGDAVRPPRVIRIPFTAPVAEDADEAWAPLPIPFLTSPGTEAAPAVPTPASEPRPPIALPTMRVFDGVAAEPAPAADARRRDAAEWAGLAEPAESTESFLARAASLAGARIRPAAEAVAVPAPAAPVPREDFAPAAQPLARLAPAEPAVTPTVLAREEAPPRPAEGIDWPAADVTDLLDALASEIAHEYRRYYGE